MLEVAWRPDGVCIRQTWSFVVNGVMGSKMQSRTLNFWEQQVSKSAEHHYVHRIGWLRAAVLGANDGIVSTASLVLGVAAASTDRHGIMIAGVAGLVAGAMSMAAGERAMRGIG